MSAPERNKLNININRLEFSLVQAILNTLNQNTEYTEPKQRDITINQIATSQNVQSTLFNTGPKTGRGI